MKELVDKLMQVGSEMLQEKGHIALFAIFERSD